MAVNPLFGSTYKYDPESGEFVDQTHVRMNAVIQQYNHNLRLIWVPKKNRTEDTVTPYAIWDERIKRPIMWFTEGEMQYPDKILGRLFRSDQEKNPNGSILARIQSEEAARDALEAQEWQDTQDERRDFAMSVLRSPLNKYTAKRGERNLVFRS